MKEILKEQIKQMKKGNILPFLYGVKYCIKDNSKKDRIIDIPLKIEKGEFNTYIFITDIFFDGHNMIKECCKILKIKRISYFLDFPKIFSYKQICQIIDILPTLFNKYSSEKSCFTYLNFDKNIVIEECEKQRLPYLIEKTETEIKQLSKYLNIDNTIKQLNKDLENYKNKLSSYK